MYFTFWVLSRFFLFFLQQLSKVASVGRILLFSVISLCNCQTNSKSQGYNNCSCVFPIFLYCFHMPFTHFQDYHLLNITKVCTNMGKRVFSCAAPFDCIQLHDKCLKRLVLLNEFKGILNVLGYFSLIQHLKKKATYILGHTLDLNMS